HDMTQTELAQQVGVSKGAISHFEKSISKPSSETLTKLSQTLGEDLRKELPRIGRFPIQSTDNNIDIAIILGNQYNRLKWDYLRRNESDVPSADEETSYGLSKTTYAYESLSLPPSLLEEGQYIVYPMPDNHMSPTFEEGDLLLCGLVNEHDWDKMDPDTDDPRVIDKFLVYVVEVWKEKERALHFGRLSFNAKRQTFRCYQDDRSVPYRIPTSDVKFLWKFRWCLTNRFHNKSQELLDKIRELEQNISELRGTHVSNNKENNSSNYRTYRERLQEIIIGAKNVLYVSCFIAFSFEKSRNEFLQFYFSFEGEVPIVVNEFNHSF
ncbi:MAG: XRE family transcriptional regulator, partial [Sphingobacteriaceae bacterium]